MQELIFLLLLVGVAILLLILQSRKQNSSSTLRQFAYQERDQRDTSASNPVNPYEEITWATPGEIQTAFDRQRSECMFCGISVKGNTRLDYIIPLTRGGNRDLENLAVSCPSCNLLENKRSRNREIWRIRARAGIKYPSKQEVHEIYKRQRQSNRMARMETDLSSFSLANLDEIYNHQNGHCNFCGGNIGKREAGFVSHIIPLAHGGKNSPENIAIVCNKCDQSRRAVFSRDWL